MQRLAVSLSLVLSLAPALTAAFATALLACPEAAAQTADDAQAAREQLEQLETEIARISAAREERREQRSTVQQQLASSELRLAGIRKTLAALAAQIAGRDREIAALETRRSALRSALQTQSAAVAQEIRRAHRGAEDDQLKLLLSQQDPQSLARMLAYYRHVLGARNRLLAEYQAGLEELAAVEASLSASRTALAGERAAVQEQQAALEEEQAQRSALLAQIDSALQTDAEQLAQREQDRAALEELLADIEAAMAAVAIPISTQPFSEAQGQMPWPVDSPVTTRFGSPRNQGKMRWQGVRLLAEAGSPVAAIHHGRVVYADWLRGAGLLLVIDHGEGYMSLYAHNETLLREVGDWVSAGAAIATVGNSGGQSEAGLYFEVRKDGRPTDPQRWCRG